MERPGEDFISHSWGDIEATHRQDGLPDPRKNPDSQSHTSLEIHLTLNIKNFNIEEPPINREKSAPIEIIYSIVLASAPSPDPNNHHISDLVHLGFYFYLRSW